MDKENEKSLWATVMFGMVGFPVSAIGLWLRGLLIEEHTESEIQTCRNQAGRAKTREAIKTSSLCHLYLGRVLN